MCRKQLLRGERLETERQKLGARQSLRRRRPDWQWTPPLKSGWERAERGRYQPIGAREELGPGGEGYATMLGAFLYPRGSQIFSSQFVFDCLCICQVTSVCLILVSVSDLDFLYLPPYLAPVGVPLGLSSQTT